MASAAHSALERLSLIERPVRLFVEVVLVIVLALMAARLVWTIAAPTDSVADFTDRPLPSPMRGAVTAVTVSVDRSVLATSNPFTQDAAAPVIEDAPETSLNLKLVGLRMTTEGGEEGNAMIQTPNGQVKNFGVGDEILAGVSLERILSDRALISRDGASETLMLGGRGAGLSVITDDSRAVSPEAADIAGVSTSAAPAPASPPIEGNLAGPDEFFGAVSASPEREGDQLIGYRLSPIGTTDTMTRAGLQPGDILQSIDGVSVAELNVSDLLDRISEIEIAELQILRDGNPQTVRLRFGE